MSSLIASQKVIQHYLQALLTEDDAEQPPAPAAVAKPAAAKAAVPVTAAPTLAEAELAQSRKAELNRLLAQAVPVARAAEPVVPATAKVQTTAKTQTTPEVQSAPAVLNTPEMLQRAIPIAERLAQPTVAATVLKTEKTYRQQRFQALFFSVAGLKIAVPLTELGGIHEVGAVNALFGKPDWFKGIMLHRQQKIQLVDTARWVMPEKYTPELATELNYQYVIMLGTSDWGLSCEQLIDTITLEPEQIKWREHEGKRPWMAGLIKEQKCVLVDVDELVNLLNQGLDINA